MTERSANKPVWRGLHLQTRWEDESPVPIKSMKSRYNSTSGRGEGPEELPLHGAYRVTPLWRDR